MTWIDDATCATTHAQLEQAWRLAGSLGQRDARDTVWFVALSKRLDDVDAVAMSELTKQLGAKPC